ncbi:MAG: hypothetical protein JNK75_06940 [Betaproteobacteria bacterium]|nr:hypothetical protein [Betaproteobacteria bacterium]
MNETVYRLLETHAEALQAIDAVIAAASQSIGVFDENPARLRERGFGAQDRIDTLRRFLLGRRHCRVSIVLHDVRAIESELPRLVALLGQFSGQVSIHRTVGPAREAHDPLVIADGHSFWHKLHIDHPRSVLTLNNAKDTQPRHERFQDILESSELAVTGTSLGL